jgi:hypothetical protein
MAGIVAIAIVILATGTILVASQNFLNAAGQKARLQRDASYAIVAMSHAIRPAGSATVADDGGTVIIHGEGGWVKFASADGIKGIIREVQGQDRDVLLVGTVQNLQFTVQGDVVSIDLKLENGQFENHIIASVMMRNN